MSEKKIRVIRRTEPAPMRDLRSGAVVGVASPGVLTMHTVADSRGKPADCEIVFFQSAYKRIMQHLSADTTREHGGLLCGYETTGRSGPIVLVTTALPALHTQGTPTRLVMPHETWVEFDRVLDQAEKHGMIRRVGWYHSHPNIPIFLSQWDLEVCRIFPRPLDLALVVDPVRDRGAFFVRGTEGFKPDQPQGFWEHHEQTPASIVSWNNLQHGASARSSLSDLREPPPRIANASSIHVTKLPAAGSPPPAAPPEPQMIHEKAPFPPPQDTALETREVEVSPTALGAQEPAESALLALVSEPDSPPPPPAGTSPPDHRPSVPLAGNEEDLPLREQLRAVSRPPEGLRTAGRDASGMDRIRALTARRPEARPRSRWASWAREIFAVLLVVLFTLVNVVSAREERRQWHRDYEADRQQRQRDFDALLETIKAGVQAREVPSASSPEQASTDSVCEVPDEPEPVSSCTPPTSRPEETPP